MTKIFKKIKLLVLTAVAGFTALSTVGGIKAAKAGEAKSYVALGSVRSTGYEFDGYNAKNNGFLNYSAESFIGSLVGNENEEDLLNLAADPFRMEDIYFELAGVEAANRFADSYYKTNYLASNGRNAMFAEALVDAGLLASVTDANADVSSVFRNAVSNAEVITLDAGLHGYIKYAKEMMHKYLEDDLLFEHMPYANLFAEPIRAVINRALESNLFTAGLIKVADEYLDIDLVDVFDLNLPLFAKDAAELIIDTYSSYCYYLNETTKLIYSLNSDVDLVVIGMSNPVANMHVKVNNEDINVGHFFDTLISLTNLYAQVGTTMAGKYIFVNPGDLLLDGDEVDNVDLVKAHRDLAARVSDAMDAGKSGRQVFVEKVIKDVNSVVSEILRVVINEVFDIEYVAGETESAIGKIIEEIEADVGSATNAVDELLIRVENTIGLISDFLLGDPNKALDGDLGHLLTVVNKELHMLPSEVVYFINYFVLTPIREALQKINVQIAQVAVYINMAITKATKIITDTIYFLAYLPEMFANQFHKETFIEFYQAEASKKIEDVSALLSGVFVWLEEQIETVVKQAIALPYYPIQLIRSVLTSYIVSRLQEYPLDSLKIAASFINLFGEDVKEIMDQIANSPVMSEEAKHIYDVLFNLDKVIDENYEKLLESENAVSEVIGLLEEIINKIDTEVSPFLVAMFDSFIESIEGLFHHTYHVEREEIDGEIKFFAVCDICGMREEVEPEYVWGSTYTGVDSEKGIETYDVYCKAYVTFPGDDEPTLIDTATVYCLDYEEPQFVITGNGNNMNIEIVKEGYARYAAYFEERDTFKFRNQVKIFDLIVKSGVLGAHVYAYNSSSPTGAEMNVPVVAKEDRSLFFEQYIVNGTVNKNTIALRNDGYFTFSASYSRKECNFTVNYSKEFKQRYYVDCPYYTWSEDGRSCLAAGDTMIDNKYYTIKETASLDNGKVSVVNGDLFATFGNPNFPKPAGFTYGYDIVVTTTKEFSADSKYCTETAVYSIPELGGKVLYSIVSTYAIQGISKENLVKEGGVVVIDGGVEIAFNESALNSLGTNAALYADVSEDGKVLNIDVRDGEEKASFDGEVTITMPFDEEVPEGYQVKVYCVDGEEPVDMYATIDENGNVVFTTTHFSTYKIVVEEIPAEPAAPEKAGLGLWWILIAAVALICVASLVYVFVIRPRGKKAKKETK